MTRNQPPNNYDFNVLDLGFFNTIQSLRQKDAPKNVDELISAVIGAYNQISRETLNNNILSYRYAMESSLQVGGGNN